MPIGFRRELAGVRNVQLQLARDKAVLEDLELNAVLLLSDAVRKLESNRALAETHFNRWSAAEKEVESVNALYKGGKQTVDLVLQAQERRAQAQAEFYRSLIEYNETSPTCISASAPSWNITTSNWPKAIGRRRRTGMR